MENTKLLYSKSEKVQLSTWRNECMALVNSGASEVESRARFNEIYKRWDESKLGPPPVWIPSPSDIENSNIGKLGKELGLDSRAKIYEWSIRDREGYWKKAIEKLEIEFDETPSKIFGDTTLLPGAKLNIAKSCFKADPNKIALIQRNLNGPDTSFTYQDLADLVGKIQGGLRASGLKKGDAVAIAMPMTIDAVASYLAVISSGLVAVSIADSFSAEETKTRLNISNAKAVVTQNQITRGSKSIDLYKKITKASAIKIIVIPESSNDPAMPIRPQDILWSDFIRPGKIHFESTYPEQVINILFSSGTTGDPKAIPWNHTTPIKSAADAHFHHDFDSNTVAVWPTNLGWMMGPWLVFATLIHGGTIGLFSGLPTTKEFCKFVEEIGTTFLGVIPSIVKQWRTTSAPLGCNWKSIKCFSSTGECSNADDMFYLMFCGKFRPVIEYCGGTEIGGGYISSTLLDPNIPSTFSTPTFGLELCIIDGEVFLIPPSLGLSTTLLNKNHEEVYFAGAPSGPGGNKLRRHGDEIALLPNGYFRALGRADDTMNLGGIKTSAVEIERVLNTNENILESAAVAVIPKGGGPSLLVVFWVPKNSTKISEDKLQAELQTQIRSALNPLFKISKTIRIDALPRTASNKVMRRALRNQAQ